MTPPYTRVILYGHETETKVGEGASGEVAALALIRKSIDNHVWRQENV